MPGHEVLILGTGGNSIDVLETICLLNRQTDSPEYDVIGFLDDNIELAGEMISGIPVIGPLEKASGFPGALFVNAIGSVNNFSRRAEIIQRCGVKMSDFATIIHPSATVSESATVGAGSVILSGVTVSSHARIGNHVMMLPNAIVSHDSSVGDFTCIAGGVCISGKCRIGASCYLGAGALIKDYVTIGGKSLVGMGSVVIRDVEEGSRIAGNPAAPIRSAEG